MDDLTARFASYDGTQLAYRAVGTGPPLVCLPGGPGRAADYLGHLGGLDASRRLVLLDSRGVGRSADPATFRVDRLTADVDALRAHLGLAQMDLLAHSAGAVLAMLYAAAHPERISRLVLITPGLAAVGVGVTEEEFQASWRAGRPSRGTRPPWPRSWPGRCRWRTSGRPGRCSTAAGTMRLARTRRWASRTATRSPGSAISTAPTWTRPPSRRRSASSAGPPGAGHFPWVDDPAAFAAAVTAFLA